MKKDKGIWRHIADEIVFGLIIGLLMFLPFSFADIDTIEGQATSGLSDFEGETLPNKVEGQTVVASGSVGTSAEDDNARILYPSDNYHFYSVTDTAGKVRYGHIKVIDGQGADFCLSLVSQDGSTVYLSASETASDNQEYWLTIDMGSSYTIEAATTYLISVQVDDNTQPTVETSAAASGQHYWDDNFTYNCGAGVETPEQETSWNRDIIIVFDNSPGDPT